MNISINLYLNLIYNTTIQILYKFIKNLARQLSTDPKTPKKISTDESTDMQSIWVDERCLGINRLIVIWTKHKSIQLNPFTNSVISSRHRTKTLHYITLLWRVSPFSPPSHLSPRVLSLRFLPLSPHPDICMYIFLLSILTFSVF